MPSTMLLCVDMATRHADGVLPHWRASVQLLMLSILDDGVNPACQSSHAGPRVCAVCFVWPLSRVSRSTMQFRWSLIIMRRTSAKQWLLSGRPTALRCTFHVLLCCLSVLSWRQPRASRVLFRRPRAAAAVIYRRIYLMK